MRGGARVEKGSEEALARMAKVREARAAKSELPTGDSHAPFPTRLTNGVDVDGFTGLRRDFPQTSFGVNFIELSDQQSRQIQWPGDEVK